LGQGSSPRETGFNRDDAICLCKAG
jgi:hypothetical protein